MTSTKSVENALGDSVGQDLVAGILERKARSSAELAREAVAQHQLHRPAYGEQHSVAVPITQRGTLDTTLHELVAGRSRRYSQDLEGWCRAALADPGQRGVLVVWDGMLYTITLAWTVPPRTITEVHRRDLPAWLAVQGAPIA